ncbi:MAG: hypothetical protein ACYCVB_10520 [Bacilli bacterium]
MAFKATAILAATLLSSSAIAAAPLETATRLHAQAQPYVSLTVEAPSHEVFVALPFSSLPGLERDAGAPPAKRVRAAVVYDLPTLSASGRARLAQTLQRRLRPQTILLAPESWAPAHSSALETGPDRMIWLRRDRKEAVPGLCTVSVHVLPRVDQNAQPLAMLHIDAPHVSVGVIYRVPVQTTGAWPREHDVIILQLSKLYPVVDVRSLTILDPEVAIVVNDRGNHAADPALNSMIEHLRDLWVDVYQVASGRPFVILAGSHGLLLPLYGAGSGKSAALQKNLAGNRR